MTDIRERIDAEARSVEAQMIEWRHALHRNPELSAREVETAAFVADRLRSLGLEVTTGVGGHGVVAVLTGGAPGTGVVGLRADMDALPIKELQDLPYASTKVDDDYPGGPFPVAHMCGHDVHTAALLGAATVLAAVRDELPGTVKFLFQPAEEGPPIDESAGAASMVAQGALDDPVPGLVFALHTAPFPDGTVAYAPGNALASSDYLSIVVHGAGVHGSTPWAGLDPMPVAAEIITALAQVYRQVPATDAMTISIGKVVDQGRFNVIGDSVELIGTIRLIQDELVDDVKRRVERIASNVAQAHGLTATTTFLQHVPGVHNEPAWLDRVLPTVRRVMGEENVFEQPPALGYDDASEFINRAGGAYLLFGGQDVELDAGGPRPRDGGRGLWFNHSPHFYFNDANLVGATRMHAHVALDFLSGVI